MTQFLKEGELDYIKTPRLPFSGGVNTDVEPELLKDGESSDGKNFILRRGVANVRRGISEYGDSSTFTNRENPINGLYAFSFADGTTKVIAISSYSPNPGYVYVFTGSGSWTDISGSPVPVIANASPDYPWDFAFGMDNNIGAATSDPGGAVYMVNGFKRIYFWDGVTSSVTDAKTDPSWDPPSGLTYLGGRYITVFGGRLVLAYTSEDGYGHGLRVRYSDVNNFLTFNVAHGGHVVDLADSSGEITGMWTLGDKLYIAKRDAIVVGVETGNPTVPIAFPTYIDSGCLVGRSFQPISENTGIFLGVDNVYMISEGQVKKIGDPIRDDLLSKFNYKKPNPSTASMIDPELGLYYLWVDYNWCFIYNWVENTWSKAYYSNGVYAACRSGARAGTTIDSLTDTIDSYSDPIDDWGGGESREDLIVTTEYNSTDYRVGYLTTVTEDLGEYPRPVTTYIDSKDFVPNPGGYSLLRCFELFYVSSSDAEVRVRISTDKGETWSDTSSAVLPKSTEGGYHRYYFRTYGRTFRFRIEVSSGEESTASGFPITIYSYSAEFSKRGEVRR